MTIENETGEIRIRDMNVDFHDYSLFWLTEGNFGCDCNRHLEFERAGNNEVFNDDRPCGSEKYSVLYAEFPDGTKMKIDDDDFSD